VQENEVVARIRAGDHSAFQQLFETYKTMVFNLCFRMLGDREEAEDLTQEVFFKAYKSLEHFRSQSKLPTWLYRIGVNLCLNYQRKKKYARMLSLDSLFESADERIFRNPEDSPDMALEKNETERIVRDAVNSLPRRQRIALLLRRYEGLSYQEIANVMGCSVASVESCLHRAKQNLCKKLFPLIKDL